jgi:hypothetical protein
MKAEPLKYGDKTEYKDPLALQVAAAETPLLPVYWGITQHKDVDKLGSRDHHVGNARLEWNGYDAIEGDVELFEELPDELKQLILEGKRIPLSCWYSCDIDGDTQKNIHLKHILLTDSPRSPHTAIQGDVIERVIVGDTINFRGDDEGKGKDVKAMPEDKPEEPKKESKPVREAAYPEQEMTAVITTEEKPKQTGLKLGKDMEEFVTGMRDQLKEYGSLDESIVDSLTPNQLAKQLKHAKAAEKPEEAGIQDKPAPAGLPPPTKKDEFKDYEYDQHKHGATMKKEAFVKQSNEDFEKHWGKPANIEHTKPPLIGGEGITVSKGPISIAEQKKARSK